MPTDQAANVYLPSAILPPPEYHDHRWHWIATPFGIMAASWYPMKVGAGTWDISGISKPAHDPDVRREWRYIGPAIPPGEKTDEQ